MDRSAPLPVPSFCCKTSLLARGTRCGYVLQRALDVLQRRVGQAGIALGGADVAVAQGMKSGFLFNAGAAEACL